MKLTKLIFIILCIAIITSSCKSVKEGLTGQKKAHSDEITDVFPTFCNYVYDAMQLKI